VQPHTGMTLQIRKLLSLDIEPAANLLARVFETNPAYRYLYPPGMPLVEHFRRDLSWRQEVGTTWVLTRDGDVLGTASVDPPDRGARGPKAFVRHWVMPMLRGEGFGAVLRLARTEADVSRWHRQITGRTDYWEVKDVAIAPLEQGKGFGTELVRHVMAQLAGTTTAPLVLSTQRKDNLSFYRRFGFEVQIETGLGDALRPFVTWFMCRPEDCAARRQIQAA
jgi:GNAT superfamily N-acetyltransferase